MPVLMPESTCVAAPLPPRLQQLLEALPDRYLAERLSRVWHAAREALEEVERLVLVPAGLDEPGVDPAGLSLWEHVAPAVRDTLMALNRLFWHVRTDFPAQPPEDFTPSDGAPIVRAQPAEQAARTLGRAAARLCARAELLGERLRRPEHAEAPQELEGELREMHRSLRSELRDLVVQSAAAFGLLEPCGPAQSANQEGPAAESPRRVRAVPGALSGAELD